MKKFRVLLVCCVVVLLASCTVTKPTYNPNRETLVQHQKDMQKYYIKVQKKRGK